MKCSRILIFALGFLYLVIPSLIRYSCTNSLSSTKLEELRALRRSHKRKAGQLEDDDENVFDPAFIAADQHFLSEIRATELPAHTRTTVLSKPTAVS